VKMKGAKNLMFLSLTRSIGMRNHEGVLESCPPNLPRNAQVMVQMRSGFGPTPSVRFPNPGYQISFD
jgi:hypothetical protein